jgi:hypothetical protein
MVIMIESDSDGVQEMQRSLFEQLRICGLRIDRKPQLATPKSLFAQIEGATHLQGHHP